MSRSVDMRRCSCDFAFNRPSLENGQKRKFSLPHLVPTEVSDKKQTRSASLHLFLLSTLEQFNECHFNESAKDTTFASVPKNNFDSIVEVSALENSVLRQADVSKYSVGPVCRICHGNNETLISPCNCSGSVNFVHKSCLENWLTTSNRRDCEICGYTFTLCKVPLPFYKYLCSSSNIWNRALFGDLFCFLILTPFTVASAYLCIYGAVFLSNKSYQKENSVFSKNSHIDATPLYSSDLAEVHRTKKQQNIGGETPGLVLLALMLLVIYAFWVGMAIRYHIEEFKIWQSTHCTTHLVALTPDELDRKQSENHDESYILNENASDLACTTIPLQELSENTISDVCIITLNDEL